jgi:hypothetical protein
MTVYWEIKAIMMMMMMYLCLILMLYARVNTIIMMTERRYDIKIEIFVENKANSTY